MERNFRPSPDDELASREEIKEILKVKVGEIFDSGMGMVEGEIKKKLAGVILP